MVYRVYVEKKREFAEQAESLKRELQSFLQINELTDLRLLQRYDVENISAELFEACKRTVFAEPQVDELYDELPTFAGTIFAAEYLPGQFDQRADSAAQCIQLISQKERPIVRTARVYLLEGNLSAEHISSIQAYVINPVESRAASLTLPATLNTPCELPTTVKTLNGFTNCDQAALQALLKEYALAMDLADLQFCQEYFRKEQRNPTLTELRMIDTYWSDHCRHTTFLTQITHVSFDNPAAQAAFDRYQVIRAELGRKKPVTLMDIATIGAKYLKHTGDLTNLDESEEINACTVKIDVDVDGQAQKWLLLFKNETHNHPTEIEPFGGAATCIGGAIRDPLSGRGYVYQAMRVTGAADPRANVEDTLPGKLPQRKLVTTAAAGYSSYGNQIGLATGLVDEIYHPGYAAKHMEIGAVVGAAPAENVVRKCPLPGDQIVLLGGRTGRDGCGGATGSSKSHNLSSLEQCGAEVQKGNAPEERKLQRLFRNPEAARMIKRCNDFGAGGVSVAIGELADGLDINLDAVPKKYDGLDGTELAISESQERMAVVLRAQDVDRFMALAGEENLEATVVASVTDLNRLRMVWNGARIVDLCRDFLNSNGAPKFARAYLTAPAAPASQPWQSGSFADRMRALVSDINICSRQGLCERFDSTIGSASVLMPFGGVRQLTPAQAMAAKLPVSGGRTTTCSLMAYGYNPYLTEASPYHGAYLAVIESVAKLVAVGAAREDCYLTLQEYFQRMTGEPEVWGKPMAALLGALDAQLDLGVAAIGGKDSMSGSFESLHVPPTLVSFAVAACPAKQVISNEFKRTGSRVMLLRPALDANGLPDAASQREAFEQVRILNSQGKVLAAYAPGFGGISEAIFKMGLGNQIGFAFAENLSLRELFSPCPGSIILELADDCSSQGILLGHTVETYALLFDDASADSAALEADYYAVLEPVYPRLTPQTRERIPKFSYTAAAPKRHAAIKLARPRALIPVFPGTNCEYDTASALERAGAIVQTFVINNLTAQGVSDSVERFAKALMQSQILFLPGGFSGGDEPDGSGKFITAFLRNPRIHEQIDLLLNQHDGLIGGICNGFQALIKLGLVPFGEIRKMDESCPTLTFNAIGRHQSRLVRTRIASNLSPWLMHCAVGDVHVSPVSHGEGRFVCSSELLTSLADSGQIATQYVDEQGEPSMHVLINPNGSICAVEGITSPDGRVFGKMAHSERVGEFLYKNVPGNKDNGMFRSAVDYFMR